MDNNILCKILKSHRNIYKIVNTVLETVLESLVVVLGSVSWSLWLTQTCLR